MPVIVIDNFSGGLNKNSAERLAPNEASELTNLVHVEGNLRVFDGKTTHASGNIGATSDPVVGACRYYSGGTGYSIVNIGNRLWLDTQAASQPWRPISAAAFGGANVRVSMTPFGGRVYIGRDTGRPYRYDNFYHVTGSASCAGGTSTVAGVGTSWTTANVRKGDQIFFYVGSAWSGSVNAYTIQAVGSETALTLDGNGPNTSGAVPYVISRTHFMGIEQPTDTITATNTAGAGLTVGRYSYRYTHYNSQTATESLVVTATAGVTTTTANARVVVASIATPTDPQIDQLKLYRTKVGGIVHYLLTTLNRNQTGHTFAASYTDSTADASLGAQVVGNHQPPPQGLHYVAWNNRLYGYGKSILSYTSGASYSSTAVKNQLWFSTLNAPEYWPAYDFGVDAPGFTDESLGGYVTVGDADSAVRALAGEGNIGDTDRTGSSLLVFKERGMAYRWYGYTWMDFELHEAFASDCMGDSARSGEGIVLWVSKKGPMAVPMQSRNPIRLYERLFPIYSAPWITTVQQNDSYQYDRDVTTAIWRDWFIIAYPASGANYNNRMIACHLPTLTFTQIGGTTTTMDAACLAVWDGPGDSGELYAGDANSNKLWRLFNKTSSNTYWTGSTGVQFAYASPILMGLPVDTYRVKHINEVRLYCHRPTANTTVNAQLLENARATGARETLTIPSAGSDGRVIVKWHPRRHGWGFQARLSGTATVPVVVERIDIDYKVEGKA